MELNCHTGTQNQLQPAKAHLHHHVLPEVTHSTQHQGPREAAPIRRLHQWHAGERHVGSVLDLWRKLTSCPDYLQALQDENKISVEKIGSGNWYWSFASEDKKTRERALTEAQSAHDKAAALVNELKEKAAEARAQRQDEEDTLDNGGESREDFVATKSDLDKEVKALQKQLAAYSDSDPTELERKHKEIEAFKVGAEQYTEMSLTRRRVC